MGWTWSSLMQFPSSRMPKHHKHPPTPHRGGLQLSSIAYVDNRSSLLPIYLPVLDYHHRKLTLSGSYVATCCFPKYIPPQNHLEWYRSELLLVTNCWKEKKSKNCHRWEDSCSVLWRWRNKPGQSRAQHPDLLSIFMDPTPQENAWRSSMGRPLHTTCAFWWPSDGLP